MGGQGEGEGQRGRSSGGTARACVCGCASALNEFLTWLICLATWPVLREYSAEEYFKTVRQAIIYLATILQHAINRGINSFQDKCNLIYVPLSHSHFDTNSYW